jgi:hypothetical protein
MLMTTPFLSTSTYRACHARCEVLDMSLAPMHPAKGHKSYLYDSASPRISTACYDPHAKHNISRAHDAWHLKRKKEGGGKLQVTGKGLNTSRLRITFPFRYFRLVCGREQRLL